MKTFDVVLISRNKKGQPYSIRGLFIEAESKDKARSKAGRMKRYNEQIVDVRV